MFVIGWNHDIGYEFSTEQNEHASIGEEMLKQVVCSECKEEQKILHTIRKHTMKTKTRSVEWFILTYSDLTIDHKGNECTIQERLDDIKIRYGDNSEQYISTYDVVDIINEFMVKKLENKRDEQGRNKGVT